MRFRTVLLAALLAVLPAFAMPPERLFLNGRVWTGDPARPRAEALLLRGDRIAAVGSSAALRKRAGRAAEVVDLGGAFVVPGFIDAHQHFFSGSLSLERLDLAGCDRLEVLQARLDAHAKAKPKPLWIDGRGWVYSDFPGQRPHRRHLDAVVPDRPVFLRDRDGHAALVNSMGLALAGITRGTTDPEGGIIDRDADGSPTGLLKEGAKGLVAKLLPKPSQDEWIAAARKGLARAAEIGLTAVHEAGIDEEGLAVLDRLSGEGSLTLRFYLALEMRRDPTPERLAAQAAERGRNRGGMVRIGAVKGYLDGTVDSRTAWMFEPYLGGGTGLPEWNLPDFEAAVKAYDKAGWQVWIHAIGDRAIAATLDAYAGAAQANGSSGRRHRIEHLEVPRPADLPRFQALGVVASTQAPFALPDKSTVENYAALLGPARTARANAFHAFDAAGAVQAFGSDWPVYSNDPLLGIYVAATRQNPDGTPIGGWHPEARIGVEAALRHYTRDAAWAAHQEREKGVLKPGFLADLTILSRDLLAIPAAEILKAKVLRTVVGGRDAFVAQRP